jgi:hypothetical protein
MPTNKMLPFGSTQEGREYRRGVKVSQADRRFSEPGCVSHQFL